MYFHESRGAWLPALAGLLLLDAPLAAAQQQDSLGISETYPAASFSRQIGRRINFFCPAVKTPSTEIWGTGVYATDSAICSAAIHAGVLVLGEAGPVSIVIGPVVANVQGSIRYGVKSQSYTNGVLYSFTFVKPESPAAIDWVTNALGLPRDYKPTINVICPPGGNADAFIWGTDTYIVDSAVCVAAVHAGVIGFGGGAVAVTKVPGLPQYDATLRNGVSSIAGSAWDDGYIVAAGVAGTAPATASDGRRVIRTTGYTAAGDAVDISPRTIHTAGYEGTGAGAGAGADIVPRVIHTRGWTAIGGAP